MDKKKNEALTLVEQSLNELESSKGTLIAAVQKLQRAASLVDDEEIVIWCKVQQGDPCYTDKLKGLIELLIEVNTSPTDELRQQVNECYADLESIGLKADLHCSIEELNVKNDDSGGGYSNIGFIQEKYLDLVKLKKGNDKTYYKNHLQKHIAYVKRKAHDLASDLYSKIKFSGTVSSCFDVLKSEVDDQILDLNPELAEQLMLAFKSVSSNNPEEWSHALTTCRRLLEGLADELFPVTTESVNGRALKQGQYVNRLWAFMDKSIESASNRELAKTHVDFLGSWLEKVNKLTNKGVHAELEQIEAVKAVFHTYMVIADLLGYLAKKPTGQSSKININEASIDQLEALLGVGRNTAKEIFKYRIKEGYINKVSLRTIPGVGEKTLQKAELEFEID
ncbi:ComEA family DNA-binding protein [Vreelandella venusta]|uniref:ComEA family DNA-binding protein n=1 Tax=Vreelandella venusta TaxID=44935 RepID=UPI0018DA37BE|nr:helix-hairpin-helix domain-containing protein [Halomonas venusta]QPI65549.1 helix-hairpin-helix domain-containing protein [Halomonas venusta]